jgi:hypothetical protein
LGALNEGVAAGAVIEGVLDLGLAAGNFPIDGGLDFGVGMPGGRGLDVGHSLGRRLGSAGGSGEEERSAEGEDGGDGEAARHGMEDTLRFHEIQNSGKFVNPIS